MSAGNSVAVEPQLAPATYDGLPTSQAFYTVNFHMRAIRQAKTRLEHDSAVAALLVRLLDDTFGAAPSPETRAWLDHTRQALLKGWKAPQRHRPANRRHAAQDFEMINGSATFAAATGVLNKLYGKRMGVKGGLTRQGVERRVEAACKFGSITLPKRGRKPNRTSPPGELQQKS